MDENKYNSFTSQLAKDISVIETKLNSVEEKILLKLNFIEEKLILNSQSTKKVHERIDKKNLKIEYLDKNQIQIKRDLKWSGTIIATILAANITGFFEWLWKQISANIK